MTEGNNMTNLVMALYILDETNKHYVLDKRNENWVIETDEKQFWYNEDGSYYGTITKIPELEDM